MSAPLLRLDSASIGVKSLEAAYEAWRVHHTACPTCQLADWYTPGAPRLYDDPPPTKEASLYRQMRRPNGKPVWLFSLTESDVGVLCTEGGTLFDRWRRVSIRFASITPANSPDD